METSAIFVLLAEWVFRPVSRSQNFWTKPAKGQLECHDANKQIRRLISNEICTDRQDTAIVCLIGDTLDE